MPNVATVLEIAIISGILAGVVLFVTNIVWWERARQRRWEAFRDTGSEDGGEDD